jgi:hypothetical protein
MNTTLRIDSAAGTESANQAPTVTSATIKAEQSTTEAISNWVQASARLAPVILEGFAGVFAVQYLLGVCAFAAALLFYTFSR